MLAILLCFSLLADVVCFTVVLPECALVEETIDYFEVVLSHNSHCTRIR